MMGEDKSLDGLYKKTRTVLGDVSNWVGKRGFSSISCNPIAKSGDGYCENAKNREGNLKFAKKSCQEVENSFDFVNDKDKSKRDSASLRPCSENNSLNENVISYISKISSTSKDSNFLDHGFHLGSDNVDNNPSVLEVGDASRDSCVSVISVPESLRNRDCLDVEGKHQTDGVSLEVGQANTLNEQLVTGVMNEGNDFSVDNLDLSKCGSIDFSRLPESQESRSSGLERCIGVKGDQCSNSNAGVDLIKACSCSFCTKAAYIWSDLHYQDIKGRVAALKKSKKEASVLVQRSCRNTEIESHGQGNTNKLSKIESDLMGQWRSLFLHMEDILGHESSQLEASLFTLKDLRH